MKERQLELIESAGRILTASGVKGLTIKNLAKEMKFSESAIYRHFKSKEDIIVAMLNYLATAMDECMSKGIQPGDTPDRKLKIMFKNRFEFFEKKPQFVVAVFSDGLLEDSETINKAIFKIMAITKKHLSNTVKEGQRDGVFIKTLTKDELVHVVMGAFRLLMFKWRADNFNFNIMETGNKMILSLLKLIKK